MTADARLCAPGAADPADSAAIGAPAAAQPASSANPWRRILVLHDDSVPARKALAEAAALAASCGGELSVLHVFDAVRHLSGFEPASVIDGAIERARARTAESMRAACERAERGGARAQGLVIDGPEIDIAMLVAAQARRMQADVIVIGTHGRHGLDRLLMGSVAESVLRRAHVPVLLVRAADE